MKKNRKWIFILSALLGTGAIIGCSIINKGGDDVELRSTSAMSKELELNIMSTGSIQPVTMVEVGTQVSGIVEKIYVDFNSEVVEGQLLASLDKLTLNERVRQSKAVLENAKSNAVYAEQNYQRTKRLYDQGAATAAKLEEAENKLQTANGSVISSEADYSQACVNLSYADIYSPISGRILNRAVDEGQTVAASFSTPTLFTIANDLKKMQVEVDVDEADIGHVKVGQSASFTVDTYPGEEFSGTVSQIRLEPTESSNVITYTVIVDAPNPDERLYPGMTANITITTQSPKGICVPSEALYFNPSPETVANYTIVNRAQTESKVWYTEGEKIISKDVTVGASDGVETIILSGVNLGDNIITGIVPKIKAPEGESVSIMGPPKGNRPPPGSM